MDKKEYSYYKPSTKGLDFEGLISDLKVACFMWPTVRDVHVECLVKRLTPCISSS